MVSQKLQLSTENQITIHFPFSAALCSDVFLVCLINFTQKRSIFQKAFFQRIEDQGRRRRTATNKGWYFNASLAYEGRPFCRPNTLPSLQICANVSAKCRNACFYSLMALRLNNLSHSCVTLRFNAKQKKLAVSSIVSHNLKRALFWPIQLCTQSWSLEFCKNITFCILILCAKEHLWFRPFESWIEECKKDFFLLQRVVFWLSTLIDPTSFL